MTKVLCTIWSLLLYLSGISIFQPCLYNLVRDNDDEDEAVLTGPRLTSCIFVSGVYIITTNISMLPSTFKKPSASMLCLYEFFATSFILDFSATCIWTPIDVMIMTRLPKAICHTLNSLDYDDAAEWIVSNQLPMMATSFGMSVAFFLTSIHVTRALDLTMYNECGTLDFADYARKRLWQRILSELRKASPRERCPYKSPIESHQSSSKPSGRKKQRSRSRRRSP
ncbi:uncharacterized protein LOC107038028 [Diachasma alloeum]|uniref:uncharacterized protein LOC107038028 n=1 Tax=Diachasma alloeum TaxID=454923 RepID=UPI0007382710|nr:uncharacterized protein LOC107038028 [Diachasma alloeum]